MALSRPHPYRRTLLAIALVLAIATGCGSDDASTDDGGGEASASATSITATPDDTRTTADTVPTTQQPTTTTEPPTDEEAILATVDGYWQTLFESSAPPDPNHPGLDRYLAGDALATTRSVIEERQQLGQAVRLPEDSAYGQTPTEVSIAADAATVETCAVDDGVLYDVISSTALNDAVTTGLWQLTLVQDGGTWKVASAAVVQEWDGVSECNG